ncbi:MAG: hypothetical protein ING89_19785 [Rubrivivax sp.]|nr:hypothetical protein [Rubrivivax sp.]
MNPAADFARHVPGFDFLQGLLKNAGAGLPNVGRWIAPTLDPEELDKRIQELKTVQFWLEQNAKLLATTIQALEVQRMTLATLKGMNLPMADLSESLKIRPWSTEPAAAPAPPPSPEPAAPADEPPAAPRRKAAAKPGAAKAAAAPAMVDPMQWWGALTQQFTDLAAQALKDGTLDGARTLAGAAVKQSVDTATGAFKAAAGLPAKAARAAGAAGAKAAKATPAPARRAPRKR